MLIKNLRGTRRDPMRRGVGKNMKSAGVTIGGKRLRTGETIRVSKREAALYSNQIDHYARRGWIQIILEPDVVEQAKPVEDLVAETQSLNPAESGQVEVHVEALTPATGSTETPSEGSSEDAPGTEDPTTDDELASEEVDAGASTESQDESSEDADAKAENTTKPSAAKRGRKSKART